MLVGKVTPKGETQRRRKRSCCAPSSAKGFRREGHLAARAVGHRRHRHDVQVFTREGIERDKRAQSIIDDHCAG